MAKLYQNPCSIADFQLATFTFWFRIPSATRSRFSGGAAGGSFDTSESTPGGYQGGIELLTFGDPDGFTNGSISLTGMSPFQEADLINPSASGWNITAFFGNDAPFNWGIVDKYDNPSGILRDRYFIGKQQCAHVAFLPGNFLFDAWHHLLVSIDLSTGDILSSGAPDNPSFYTLITRGRIIEIYYDTQRITGSFLSMFDLDGDSNPLQTPMTQLINGFEIAVPTFVVATYNPIIQYAEFQTWFGQYIDPAAQMSKFVGSDGRPVSAEVAEIAFGRPNIRFRRDKKLGYQFKDNQGAAGAFTAIGSSLTDFTPGPFG